MCLERVYDRKPTEIGVGYKWFRQDYMGSLKFAVRRWNRQSVVPQGRWIKAQRVKVYGWHYGQKARVFMYMSGFHVYRHKPAIWADLTKVYYKQAKMAGKQDNVTTVVANYLYVPKGDEKPPDWTKLLARAKVRARSKKNATTTATTRTSAKRTVQSKRHRRPNKH